jgi:hypothetical protein
VFGSGGHPVTCARLRVPPVSATREKVAKP